MFGDAASEDVPTPSTDTNDAAVEDVSAPADTDGADAAELNDGDAPNTPDADPPSDSADASLDLDADDSSDVEADNGPVWRSCGTDADCADPHMCTTDRCEPEGYCVWTVTTGCLIANVCVDAGTSNPNAACEVCKPSTSLTDWSLEGDDVPCIGACEALGRCKAGECVDLGLPCDDGNPCTNDSCPGGSCQHVSDDGLPCDDGQLCTEDDTCLSGLCTGSSIGCGDHDPCTADSCDPASGLCVNAPAALPCDDGDPCTGPDQCANGLCASPPLSCDDLNACTIDFCHPVKGCVHLPTQNPCCLGVTSLCNDGNDSTIDDCDQSGGCSNEPRLGTCDDGDACTSQDACASGLCVGTAVTCTDGDPCTTDACDPTKGCYAVESSGAPCDDGVECTTDDTCTAGVCAGDASGCQCVPTLAPLGLHVTKMRLGTSGQPGEGLDLDKNAGTCQPASDCTAGIDNAFGPLAILVNNPIQDAVSQGDLIFLFELGTMVPGPTRVAVHTGNASGTCGAPPCTFQVELAGFHPESCQALYEIGATWTGATLKTSGATGDIPFQLPLGGGSALELTLRGAQLQAQATSSGTTLTQLEGILAGAVAKGELLSAIAKVPPALLPADPALIASLIEGVIVADVDADGDGLKESASVALLITAVPATLELP